MKNVLTPDQVTAAVPDASSLKAGRDLGSPRKWQSCGKDDEVLWGLAMGSGANPYQTRVSLADLASKCSCPSRKFPCKHALGLMFLATGQPAAMTETERPAWVTEWLDGRAERAGKAAVKAQEKAAAPVDEKAAEKRRAKREGRIGEGVDLLRQALRDRIREGLAAGDARSPAQWENLAKRMIDCQAPGLAGSLRHIGESVLRDPEVDTELAMELGRLHLMLHVLGNDELPNGLLRAELSALVGDRAAIDSSAGERVEDEWFVAARNVEERDRLITSSTWLLGRKSGRWARTLRFAPAHQTIAEPWPFGSTVPGVLNFQPGLHPLRAASENEGIVRMGEIPEAHEAGLDALLGRFAAALAQNPFLRSLPFLIPLVPADEPGFLTDHSGSALPWRETEGARLLVECICGGRPTPVCGEWNGHHLRLLSILDGDAWVPLTSQQA